MRNSFVLYVDAGQHIELLTDAEAGALTKALFRYVGTGEVCQGLSPAAAMAFSFIRAQVDRDGEKYAEICKKRAEAGRKGAEKTNGKRAAKSANADSATAKPADNDTDNVPVNEINRNCAKAVQLLNDLSGSSFRATTKSTQKLIAAREKDGYTLEDIEMVIRHQCGLWGKDANMSKYLRPETLFGNKFEGYLSDARRNSPGPEPGYTLASLDDPWEVAMRGGDGHV